MAANSCRTFTVLSASAAMYLLLPAIAHAQYLDPGSGSIMVQAIIAVVVGVSAAVKIYWHRIAAFMDRRSKPATKP